MQLKQYVALLMALLMIAPAGALAANHREAPITSLDRTADITDWYAFVSYEDPSKVVFILNVDPLLEPGNGPNYFPFDPNVTYRFYIDNDYDAVEDVYFDVKFQTEIRGAGVPVAVIGAGGGINAAPNAPPLTGSTTPATGLVVPPAITALDGKGSEGLAIRQTYTVTMYDGKGKATDLSAGRKLFAVPSNAGPRTMPSYSTLAKSGIYDLGNGVRIFAGTVDDPFYIDLGASFDSFNFRADGIGPVPGVLTTLQDQNDSQNYNSDTVSGYNVNSIALEVPISLVARSGKPVIGTWGATLRQKTTIRKSPDPVMTEGDLQQVQRMGNPLINELVIGNGSKDKFSMSDPKDDAQFAGFVLDPVVARVLNAVYGISVPPPPRVDLLPLVTYAAPVAPAGTPAGPPADLLRLNTAVKATPAASRKRIGLLAGDGAGFPNGRRVSDDVTDITLRAVAGVLAGPPYNGAPNSLLGDGVNTNDVPYQEVFPYVAWSQSGRDRRHVDPGEPGCAQGNGICPVQ